MSGRKVVTVLAVAAFAVAALAYPAAWALDRFCGRDVVLLAGPAYDEASVEQRRAEFDDAETDAEAKRQAIVGLYGPTTKAEVLRVLFVDDGQIVRPREDASIAILPAAKDGAHRWQAASAWFAAKIAAIGGAVACAALLLVRRFVK